METTLEAKSAQFKELDAQKTQLESKLETARRRMEELQARYRKAAADVALGEKHIKEQPSDVQSLIDKHQITVDGFETALASVAQQWEVTRQELGVLSRERAEQLEREEIQKAIDTATAHGVDMLRCHEELQTHLAFVRSIESQLRKLNRHSEANLILQTLEVRSDFFGRQVWLALIALEPWPAFVENNKKREAGYREMRGEKAVSA